jgi:hypothetical protein
VALEPDQEQLMRDFAPDTVQHQTFDWLYQVLSALARERPLCLVLEDLHWSDEATLSDELLPAAEQTAVCFCPSQNGISSVGLVRTCVHKREAPGGYGPRLSRARLGRVL